jgi:hypothetical protein
MSDSKVVPLNEYRGNLYTVVEDSKAYVLFSVTKDGCTEQIYDIENLTPLEGMALIGSLEKIKQEILAMHIEANK